MIYRDSFGRMTAKQRTDATSVYDTLIERAKKFNWSEYASRISADGNLSIAEQKHLDILKRLYETRLNKLTSRKKEALRLLGI
jgi:rubrerythrin